LFERESEFVNCVSELSRCMWNYASSVDLLPADLTLLHLAAALGMAQLITVLIKWRYC